MKSSIISVLKRPISVIKSSWKRILLVLLVIVVIYMVRTHLFGKREAITNKEFVPRDEESDLQEATLYFFYADWCPHCTRAKDPNGGPWTEFKARHGETIRQGNYLINIEEVDCSDSTDAASVAKINTYQVKGYPSIVLDKNGGDYYLYDARPEPDMIDRFIGEVI